MKLKLAAIFSFIFLLLTACSLQQSENMNGMDHGDMGNEEETEKTDVQNKVNGVQTTTFETLRGNEFTLVAKEATHQLNEEISVDALTFNGSVPGTQIRVNAGEQVKITLKNEMPDPVTIHWHGITVSNDMDGIPGVTQNAVQPGETFTYEFTPEDPGTYMYHTHQNAVEQMDRGLYGSFIVEPEEKAYDRDFTLMLDEWMSEPEEEGSGMEGMDHSSMNADGDNEETSEMGGMGHDMSEYDIFTINGKSGDSIEPLMVKEGEKVRVRLTNVGFMSHNIHLHGHDFKVAAIDGQELNDPQEIKDQVISIAPGERYDIEFTADNPGEWLIEGHGDMEGTDGMKIKIQYADFVESADTSNQSEELPEFTFVDYGSSEESEFSLDQNYDVEYEMDLNTAMDDGDMAFTVNGKTFPDTDNINVQEGDLVKVKLINNSMADDHPMHLHGHFFQVLSKNGQPLEGSSIIKDTVNLRPGDEYVIAFKADNPGNWLFHCHDLHHATAGMVNMVKYEGFNPSFTPDPNANNKPE